MKKINVLIDEQLTGELFYEKDLIKFGVQRCYLSQREASMFYDECVTALESSIEELESYTATNKQFSDIGVKMLDTWSLSLDEKKYKEIPSEIIRNWSSDKKA